VTATPGWPTLTTLSVIGGSLPPWLRLIPGTNGTARLRGTPPRGSAGSYQFTLGASNGPSSTSTQVFTLTVAPPPSFPSPATAALLVNQSGRVTTTTAGSPTASLSVLSGLPPFLTFHDNGDGTASLSGTPTGFGTYKIKLRASNGTGNAATQLLTLSVCQV